MRQNIGLVNALIRITCGFTILAWATSKLVRRRGDTMSFIVAALGGMKIAEGITRFCPLTYLFEEAVEYRDDYHDDEHYEDYEPLNPS